MQAPQHGSGRRGNSKWFAADAGGSMIQSAIENKYGLDIEVSSADMADQAVKRS
jgi:hypothetical protein